MSQCVIYKYETESMGFISIQVPAGAQFQSVGSQRRNVICFWYIVNTEDISVRSDNFIVLGTGQSFDSRMLKDAKFIATVKDGPYYWHVYGEKGKV